MDRSRRRALLALVLIGLLAAGLRVGSVDRKLVWHDEVYSRIFAAGYSGQDWGDGLYRSTPFPVAEVQRYQQHNPDRGVLDTVRALAVDEPQHPPLYYVLARAWVSVFGGSIATLRGLSVLLGLLGLPAMYQLCWELSRSHRTARLGTALLAVSPFFVLYAQEAREYALWATLLAACTGALLRATRLAETPHASRPRRLAAWGLYAALAAGSLYTSFSTAAVMIVHVGWICWRERLRPTPVSLGAAAALSVSALLFAPWAVILWRNLDAFRASMAWAATIVIPTRDLLGTLALNLSRPLLDHWDALVTWPARAAVTATLGLALAAVLAVVRGPSRDARGLVLGLIVLPVALLLVPDLVSGGIRSVSTRYLTPSLLGILVAVALGLGGGRSRGHRAATAVVLALGLVSSLWNHTLQAPWTKGISRGLPGVASLINESPGPLVIGNREQHHPGNLLALSTLLRDDARMVFLPIGHEDAYALPDHGGAVYLYSPTPPYRDNLVLREGVRLTPVAEDIFLNLWRVER